MTFILLYDIILIDKRKKDLIQKIKCVMLHRKKHRLFISRINGREEKKKMEKLNIMKVRQLENKNQYVLEDDERLIFQSYNSIIAVYDKVNDIITLGRYWDYSKTTMKHLYIFIDEVLPYGNNLKDLYNTKYTNNRRKAIQKLIDENKIKYESEVA